MKELINNFQKRNINCYFVSNKSKALKKCLSLISANSSVGFGGSVTLTQIGLLDKLRKRDDISLLDRTKLTNVDDIKKLYHKMASCDVYLSSANAITKQGQIVNVDGRGNRVSAITFGPDKVIIIAGKNKITDNLESAFHRIKTIATPLNLKRLINKPENEWTLENLWGQIGIIERQIDHKRMHVIIVDEDLGF